MARRIAYIASPGSTEHAGVPSHAARDGFEVEPVESRGATFPGDPVDLMLIELSTVEAAMRAQDLGYDGVLIGSVADYAVDVVRSAIDIPAIGCGQASMLTAASLGQRFAIVTIWPASSAWHYRGILKSSGVESQCVGVRHVSSNAEMPTLDDEDGFYKQMRAGREQMVERIAAQLRAAVREDDADVVVLGCNCMTPVARALRERVDVPVIDPTVAGYEFLAMLLRLDLRQSRAAFPKAVSDRSRLFGEVVDSVRAELDRTRSAPECQVCALADDGAASCTSPQEHRRSELKGRPGHAERSSSWPPVTRTS